MPTSHFAATILLHLGLLAASTSKSSKGTTTSSPYGTLLLLLVVVGAAYYFFMRPQRNRMRQQQQLQRQIAVGDRVVTGAGLIGRIVGFDGDRTRLEISPGVVVEVMRQSVLRRLDEPLPDSALGVPPPPGTSGVPEGRTGLEEEGEDPKRPTTGDVASAGTVLGGEAGGDDDVPEAASGPGAEGPAGVNGSAGEPGRRGRRRGGEGGA